MRRPRRTPRAGCSARPWRASATTAFDRGARLLVATFGAQTMVNGALNVLLVVTAARIFDGEGGLGLLFAMIGLGGVLGAAGAPRARGQRDGSRRP